MQLKKCAANVGRPDVGKQVDTSLIECGAVQKGRLLTLREPLCLVATM